MKLLIDDAELHVQVVSSKAEDMIKEGKTMLNCD